MTEGVMSSIARLFGFGKRDESTEMTGNKETGSFAGDLERKIGNHGTNEQLKGESEIEFKKENTQPEDTQQKDNITQEKSIEALYTKLQTSERGGFHLLSGNSAFYNQVMSSMSGIIDAMKQQFSTDTLSNLKQFDDMQARYQKLINACEAYLNRTTLTDKGQIRKGIVKNILETAQKDLIGLSNISMEFAYLPPEEQAGKSWAEIVDNARVTQLSVDNLFGMGNAKGSEASEVIPLISDKVTISRKGKAHGKLSETYYFKPEDEIDVEQETNALRVMDSVMARYSVSPKDKEILRSWAAEQVTREKDIEFADNPDGLSEEGELALEMIKMKTPGTNIIYSSLLKPSGIADEGGKVNMTKRNVATSRMAALLGLEHLVAKSYTAELLDKATGKTVKGNMMEQAEGMSGFKFHDEYSKYKKDKNENENKIAPVQNLVQRDILNLQVLDVLCGQMDRHMGNVMIQSDENFTITGIKGIDNDASFGMNTDVVSNKMRLRHDRRVYDPKTNKIVLPYMDKNLAQRIVELEPDTVRFFLKGLITDQEIEAAVKRLNLMKNAIKNTDEKCFLEDNQWNRETAQTILARGWSAGQKLDMERRKEAEEIVGKIKPRYKGIRYAGDLFHQLSDDEQKEYGRIYTKAHDMIKGKYQYIYSSTDNYLTELMISTISKIGYANGDTPQLDVKDI